VIHRRSWCNASRVEIYDGDGEGGAPRLSGSQFFARLSVDQGAPCLQPLRMAISPELRDVIVVPPRALSTSVNWNARASPRPAWCSRR
jgi:hypothetical protein